MATKRIRDSETGRFLSKKQAGKKDPATWEAEAVKRKANPKS